MHGLPRILRKKSRTMTRRAASVHCGFSGQLPHARSCTLSSSGMGGLIQVSSVAPAGQRQLSLSRS